MLSGAVNNNGLDLYALLQLQSSGQANAPGTAGTPSNSFVNSFQSNGSGNADGPAASGSSTASNLFGPDVMGLLLWSQGQQASGTSASPWSPQSSLSANANGDVTISQSELENAITAAGGSTAQANTVFNQLNGNGDGSIDPSELGSARPHHHHHHHASASNDSSGNDANGSSGNSLGSAGTAGSGSDPLSTLLDATGTSSIATNPDGSTTTTISYADGSTVTMTTPAQSTSATATAAPAGTQPTTNSTNTLEALIRLQAQYLTAPSPTSV